MLTITLPVRIEVGDESFDTTLGVEYELTGDGVVVTHLEMDEMDKDGRLVIKQAIEEVIE